MIKPLMAGLLVAAIILSGCAQPNNETNNTNLGGDSVGNNAADVPADLGNSEQELTELDSEISEMESILEDSDLQETEVLELDEGTFQ